MIDNSNCSSKTGSRRFWSTFYKEFTKENHKRKNWENLLTNKSLSQPWCNDSNTIHVQLHKKIVLLLRMQPRHQATFMQPLQCVLQHHVANLHVSPHMARQDDNNQKAFPMQSATRDSTNVKNYAHTNTPTAAWSDSYSTEEKKTSEQAYSQPPHTRAALHRRLQPLPHAISTQPLQ